MGGVVLAVVIIVGLAVIGVVYYLIGRRAAAGSALARRGVRTLVSVLAGAVVGLVGVAAFVGGDGGSPFASMPTFTSLATHPDASLHGTVAYNALPTGSAAGKKYACVDVVAASGGSPRQLFCVQQPKSMGAALTWLSDGRLQATSLDQDHWRKVIDVTTGAITEAAWSKPSVPSLEAVRGPHGEKVTVSISFGRLHLNVTSNSTRRTLLSVDVPHEYSMNAIAWSPDGSYLVVEDSASRLLLITTGANPTTRMLLDGGTGPAVTAASF